jgi:hypothetical protein
LKNIEVVLRLDIFAAAELRTLLEIAQKATAKDSMEHRMACAHLENLRKERWAQVPFVEKHSVAG